MIFKRKKSRKLLQLGIFSTPFSYTRQRCTLSQFIEGKYEMVCPFLIYIKFYMRKKHSQLFYDFMMTREMTKRGIKGFRYI